MSFSNIETYLIFLLHKKPFFYHHQNKFDLLQNSKPLFYLLKNRFEFFNKPKDCVLLIKTYLNFYLQKSLLKKKKKKKNLTKQIWYFEKPK